jgi:hypothetical protein
MTLTITAIDDDPERPIDRLACVMNQIDDLQKAAALQQKIIAAHAAGDDDVRLDWHAPMTVTDDSVRAAQDAFERISQDIEELTATIEGVAKSLGVDMNGRPAYGRITIDGE